MRFRFLPAFVVGAAVVLALAACDGDGTDGVASATDAGMATPTTTRGIELADSEAQLAFARCMREQGIDMDDPTSDGGPATIQLPRAKNQAEREKINAAAETCKEFLPNDGAGLDLDSAEVEKVRKLAQCMRANGFPDFPDPDSEGRIQMPTGTDPDDPRLKAALSKCREFAPEIG